MSVLLVNTFEGLSNTLDQYRKAYLSGKPLKNYPLARVVSLVEASELSLKGKLEAYRTIVDTPAGIKGILGFSARNLHLGKDPAALSMYVLCCVAAAESMQTHEKLLSPGSSYLDPIHAMLRVWEGDQVSPPEPSPEVSIALGRAAKLVPHEENMLGTPAGIASLLRGVLFALPENLPNQPHYRLDKDGLHGALINIRLPLRCPSALTVRVWAETPERGERKRYNPLQLTLNLNT